MKKFIATLSLLSVLVLFNGVFAFAKEEESVQKLECQVLEGNTEVNSSARSTTFIDNSIDISYSANGMYETITTGMNTTASLVGAKDIKVQIKNGNDWVTVAVSDGGEAYNTATCVLAFTYPDSIVGETYRVVCTHYGDVDGYREMYHETNGFKCVY